MLTQTKCASLGIVQVHWSLFKYEQMCYETCYGVLKKDCISEEEAQAVAADCGGRKAQAGRDLAAKCVL